MAGKDIGAEVERKETQFYTVLRFDYFAELLNICTHM